MFKNYIWKTFKLTLAVTLSILFIRSLLAEPGRINGISMEPTFLDEDVFLVEKLSLLFAPPKRGQIMQIYLPEFNEVVVKRIIGLPGEQITIKQNSVFITNANQQTWKLDEPYLADNITTKSRFLVAETYPILKDFEYFVLGDNRADSSDSRSYGFVQRTDIFGRVLNLSFFE